jgi:hypothetical protein
VIPPSPLSSPSVFWRAGRTTRRFHPTPTTPPHCQPPSTPRQERSLLVFSPGRPVCRGGTDPAADP